MLSMGALSFTAWLAALDASGLTQTRVRPSAATPCDCLLHAPTLYACVSLHATGQRSAKVCRQ